MNRFLRRTLVWTGRILALLAILLVLFYMEEDWRGASAWDACQRELAAEGETLDFRKLVPAGKPEDDLSRTPIFTGLYATGPGDVYEHPLEAYLFHWPLDRDLPRLTGLDIYLQIDPYAKRPDFPDYPAGKRYDLASWQQYYRAHTEAHLSGPKQTPAQDILNALDQFGPKLQHIEVAMSNKEAYWPVDAEHPFLTNLRGPLTVYEVGRILSLIGVAQIESRDMDGALKTWLDLQGFNPPLTRACFICPYSVILANQLHADAILWEGLHRHGWTAAQLRETESALAGLDMLALAQKTLRIERASNVAAADFIQEGGERILRKAGGIVSFDKYGFYDSVKLLNYRPRGEWDFDKVHYLRAMQDRIAAIHVAEGTLDPTGIDPVRSRAKMFTFYLSGIFLSGTDAFVEDAAFAETYRRLALLACTLEEFRLGNGHYPATLEEIDELPAHINQEVLSGKQLHYALKGDSYLLYSTGWDRQDHGGVIDPNTLRNHTDWVWPSP